MFLLGGTSRRGVLAVKLRSISTGYIRHGTSQGMDKALYLCLTRVQRHDLFPWLALHLLQNLPGGYPNLFLKAAEKAAMLL